MTKHAGWKFAKGSRIYPAPEFVALPYYVTWKDISYLLVTQLREGATKSTYQYKIASKQHGLGSTAANLSRGFVEANFLTEREMLERLLNHYVSGDVAAGNRAWDIAERLVKDCCAFGSVEELLSAKGDYRPSLYGSESARLLADFYDFVQERRGDARRAYRGSEESLPRLHAPQQHPLQ